MGGLTGVMTLAHHKSLFYVVTFVKIPLFERAKRRGNSGLWQWPIIPISPIVVFTPVLAKDTYHLSPNSMLHQSVFVESDSYMYSIN